MRIFLFILILFSTGVFAEDERPQCIPHVEHVDGFKLWVRRLMSVAHLCDYSLTDEQLLNYRADTLLRIVQGKCQRNLDAGCGPGPCESIDTANGCAILKNIAGNTRMLAIPIKKLAGVEDPQLLAKDSPNYWQCALGAKQAIENKLGQKLEREQVAYGINSIHSRTLSQLHIHADCVAPWKLAKIKKFESEITEKWSDAKYGFYVDNGGPQYRVRLVRGNDLSQTDPFKLVAELKEDGPMGDHAIAVVPVKLLDGSPGFYIFDSSLKNAQGFQQNGESFLDADCEILKKKVGSNF